jgi:hypothetical protein
MEKFTHTIKITELKKQKHLDNFSDVVVHCRWELKTFHEDHPEIVETFIGATPFQVKPEDLQNGFTDFCDLTESDLISWVEANAWNIPDIKKKHKRIILEKVEDFYEVVNNPWDHPEFATNDELNPINSTSQESK